MKTPEQIEQYKKIIAEAPETATHWTPKGYLREIMPLGWTDYTEEGEIRGRSLSSICEFESIQALNDLRTIVEQAEQLEVMKQSRDIYKDMLETVLSVANQNPTSIELQEKLKEFEKVLKDEY